MVYNIYIINGLFFMLIVLLSKKVIEVIMYLDNSKNIYFVVMGNGGYIFSEILE